jgi:hypothetical protein
MSQALSVTDFSLVLLVAGIYAAILFLILLIPIYWGVGEAYDDRERLIGFLKGLDKDTVKSILESSDVREDLLKSPEGIPGFGRMLMTLGIVVIVGITIFHLLVLSTSPTGIGFPFYSPATPQSLNQTLALSKDLISLKSQELSIVNNVVTILGGAVSAIIGFYFGAKAAEKPEEKKPPAQQPTARPLTQPTGLGGPIEKTPDVKAGGPETKPPEGKQPPEENPAGT